MAPMHTRPGSLCSRALSKHASPSVTASTSISPSSGSTFAIKGLGRRPALDTRTRLLVLIGQYVMAKSHGALEDTVRAAIAAAVPVREVLEIILQCVVYGGHTTVEPAIKVFHRVVDELGLLAGLRSTQLPLDGNDSTRSRDKESQTWHKDDVADPRFAGLMERHGWLAVGRGLAMRPRHHLNILAWLDTMDPVRGPVGKVLLSGHVHARHRRRQDAPLVHGRRLPGGRRIHAG